MSKFIIEKINKNHPIFESDEYSEDKLLFNYIEGARRFDDTELYSDGANVVICRKENHNCIWIWTKESMSSDIDLLTDIVKKLNELNIESPELFIRSKHSDDFCDLYAIASKQLDYQPNQKFSLGVHQYKGAELSTIDFKIIKLDDSQKYLIEEFYANVKEEFGWDDKKAEHFINEYKIMDVYALLIDDKPVTLSVVDCGEGKDPDIRSLVTLEKYRGNGYAPILASYLAEDQKLKNRNVMVYSNLGNKAAEKTWKKSGFEYIDNIVLLK